jgi:hypothetical protein
VWENIHYNLAVFYRRIAAEGPGTRRADGGTLAAQRRAGRLAARLASLSGTEESAKGLLRVLADGHRDDHPAR